MLPLKGSRYFLLITVYLFLSIFKEHFKIRDLPPNETIIIPSLMKSERQGPHSGLSLDNGTISSVLIIVGSKCSVLNWGYLTLTLHRTTAPPQPCYLMLSRPNVQRDLMLRAIKSSPLWTR